jgi:hypothetical protein
MREIRKINQVRPQIILIQQIFFRNELIINFTAHPQRFVGFF